MKRIILALSLLASPALAQQAPLTAAQTADALIHQAVEREVQAVLQVTELQRQISALQAQIEALKPKPEAPKP